MLCDPKSTQYILTWPALGDDYGKLLRMRQVPEVIAESATWRIDVVPTVAMSEASECDNIVHGCIAARPGVWRPKIAEDTVSAPEAQTMGTLPNCWLI